MKKKNILHFQEVSPLCNYRLSTLPRATFRIIPTALCIWSVPIQVIMKEQILAAHQAKIKRYLLTRQIRRLEKLGLRSRGLFCLERMRMQMIFPELEKVMGKNTIINFVSWFQLSLNPCPIIALSCLGQFQSYSSPPMPQRLMVGVRTPSIQNIAAPTHFCSFATKIRSLGEVINCDT